MNLRPLGSTGLEVTPIGLGLAALGRPAYIDLGRGDDLGGDRSVEAMRARTVDVLDAAWDAGVRYVDAARSYGRAEEFLAGWLDATGRRPTVGSKWGYTYVGGWRMDADEHEVKDHSHGTLTRQWAETRGHLGDRLDLYQVHSATFSSGILERPDVLDELRELEVVVGLTLSGPDQPDVLRAAMAMEATPFRCVQATWNVLEPSAGAALAEAHDAGWGVIVKEAVANGRLTPHGDPPRAVAEEARRLGVGIDAVALAVVLAQPWCDVVLSGAATVEHLRSNLDALDLDVDLDVAACAEDPDRYWARRSELDWT